MKTLYLLVALILLGCSGTTSEGPATSLGDATHFKNGDPCNCEYIDREERYSAELGGTVLFEKGINAEGSPVGKGRGYLDGVLQCLVFYPLVGINWDTLEFDKYGNLVKYTHEWSSGTKLVCSYQLRGDVNKAVGYVFYDIYGEINDTESCLENTSLEFCSTSWCDAFTNDSPESFL